MQASLRWTPPGGTLGTISREAAARADELEARRAELERAAAHAPSGPSFIAALNGGTVALIAEVKRRSPSKGAIAPGLDAVSQARAYVSGGAAAISVLTERDHFGGSTEDLVDVREAVRVPALKKDFHVDAIQLVEARAIGASAALLIARALSPSTLRELLGVGRALGLELLVEVRDEAELERALEGGAVMIGVNNRNLETLVIDPSTAERLIPLVPSGIIAVAESGITGRADVERYAAAGADAVLVGSSISAAADPVAATAALGGVRRRARGD
ncbi:MAG TPA: indole-3-glycerol phosphate synthase TrpC [Gemmatimonadaceae bacterium]|nr:indole-3-glycerol phosphate synthase TrpC [Gemmatimonadaceae bacterium]